MENPKIYRPALIIVGLFALIFPFIFSHYQVNVMTTALIYVMLGLGLNIEVGLAGLLDLGYVAFYAVGAYSYALLNYHFGLGFWTLLPAGALLAAFFGILVGFPVLRLRGDYLAIVTLAFAEILRLVLENWNAFSFGPSGISNIPRPGFFGMNLTPEQSATYMYFLLIALCLLTIFVTNRLQHSRSAAPGWLFVKMNWPARQRASTRPKPNSRLLRWAPCWRAWRVSSSPQKPHLSIRPVSLSWSRP